MTRVTYLKLTYAVASALWFVYWTIKLFYGRTPTFSAAVYCLFLFAAVPALGYAVLFWFFPWAGRTLRKS